MGETVDSNNNNATGIKYSLRPRTAGKKAQDVVDPVETTKTFFQRPKKGTQTLSKYRRKSANARERSRMREINEAFETLRRVVSGSSAVDQHGEKMTKISTLRLAMKYITALSDALLRDPDMGELQSVGSDVTTSLNDINTHRKKSLAMTSGERVNVNREVPLSCNIALSSNTRFNSRYQHSFSELLSLRSKETNSHFSFITYEESADKLDTLNGYRYCRRSATNELLADSSNLVVPSRCDVTSLNSAESLESYSVSEPTLRTCEHLPISQSENYQPTLVSNIDSCPLQGVSLEEYFIAR